MENFIRKLTELYHTGKISKDSHYRYWNYKSGRIPSVLKWLVRNPELLEALKQDSKEVRG